MSHPTALQHQTPEHRSLDNCAAAPCIWTCMSTSDSADWHVSALLRGACIALAMCLQMPILSDLSCRYCRTLEITSLSASYSITSTKSGFTQSKCCSCLACMLGGANVTGDMHDRAIEAWQAAVHRLALIFLRFAQRSSTKSWLCWQLACCQRDQVLYH